MTLQPIPSTSHNFCPIFEHVPLASLTWFKTGGPAQYFCEPTTAHEFSHAL
jgi:UDP-N-acetylenolpyruvoylglucosamine reductase